jgi:hypothetical protein
LVSLAFSIPCFSVCDFCGTKHSIERIRAKIQEIKGVVEITKGEAEKTRLLKNAETWLNLNDPKKAEEIYTQLTNDYPDDYRGWLGLLIYNCKYEKIARYLDVYSRNDGTTYNQIADDLRGTRADRKTSKDFFMGIVAKYNKSWWEASFSKWFN